MSERHQDNERRIREALLAEASEAPAPPDLWERVEPRLERPAAPPAGWRRRRSLVAAGAAAAVLLVLGGAGGALVSTGLSSEGGEQAWLASSSNDGRWGSVVFRDSTDDAWIDVSVSESVAAGLDLDDREGNRGARSEADSMALTFDLDLSGVLGPPGAPSSASEMASAGLVTDNLNSRGTGGFTGERQIISQASLALEVSDVNAAATQLLGLVESFGGFIEHISTSGGPNPKHGSAVVRVPDDRFLDTLDRIERLGRPLGQTLSQRDVTEDAIDLEARLRSERSAEQSLLKLHERAVSVSDVLTVERELARLRADIERLQAQLEFIQRSVALATITVSLVLPPGSVPVAPSAFLQVEVDDVERAVSRIRELVNRASGTMGEVIVTTRRDSQEAFLSFLVPASALDSVLASTVGDGVVIRREVQSDGRLGLDERGYDLHARVNVNIHTPRGSDLWRSIRAEVAGGFLVLISVAGALALVFRARRRRA